MNRPTSLTNFFAPAAQVNTTSFAPLAGHDVLVIADVENLSYGLHTKKLDLDYRNLLYEMRLYARKVRAHAFATVNPLEIRQAVAKCRSAKWIPHFQKVEVVKTCRGMERRSNADNAILIHAGVLAEKLRPSCIVLGTGDGNLGCDLAAYFKAEYPYCQLLTFSISGCTSARLRAESNPHIDGNFIINSEFTLPVINY